MTSIAVAIDVEPDPRLVYRHDADHWRGIERTLRFSECLRASLESVTGAPANFNWMVRMDPQIEHAYGAASYIGKRFESRWKALADRGDDVGLHTHLYRMPPGGEAWFTEFDDPAWEAHCLELGTTAYSRTFGNDCRVHSFGDRWLSETAVAALEREGILADLTAEPGMTAQESYLPAETIHGRLPDYSRAPRHPWRPAVGDWRRHDAEHGRRLTLVPLSTYRMPGYLAPTRRASLLLRRLAGDQPTRDDYVQRWVRACPGQRAYIFRLACRQLRDAAQAPLIHLVLRSSQFLDCDERIRANLEWLATKCFQDDVAYVSISRFLASRGDAPGSAPA
jgi:hypothetical protein